MELKVVCQCGQKFKFDVEPINGRMPFTVNCPLCSADGTATANAMLAEIQASQPPPLATPPPLPAPAPAGTLRINRPINAESEVPIVARPLAVPRPSTAPPSASTSTRKLEWYEHIWCALPLCLVGIGGAIGGGCGGAAWVINRKVFLKITNPVLRYLLTGMISVAAFGCYLVIAVVFVLLFHKQS